MVEVINFVRLAWESWFLMHKVWVFCIIQLDGKYFYNKSTHIKQFLKFVFL